MIHRQANRIENVSVDKSLPFIPIHIRSLDFRIVSNIRPKQQAKEQTGH